MLDRFPEPRSRLASNGKMSLESLISKLDDTGLNLVKEADRKIRPTNNDNMFQFSLYNGDSGFFSFEPEKKMVRSQLEI